MILRTLLILIVSGSQLLLTSPANAVSWLSPLTACTQALNGRQESRISIFPYYKGVPVAANQTSQDKRVEKAWDSVVGFPGTHGGRPGLWLLHKDQSFFLTLPEQERDYAGEGSLISASRSWYVQVTTDPSHRRPDLFVKYHIDKKSGQHRIEFHSAPREPQGRGRGIFGLGGNSAYTEVKAVEYLTEDLGAQLRKHIDSELNSLERNVEHIRNSESYTAQKEAELKYISKQLDQCVAVLGTSRDPADRALYDLAVRQQQLFSAPQPSRESSSPTGTR